MRTRIRTSAAVAAALTAGATLATLTAFPAVAADGDVDVVNTETVQAYTDATGKVQSKRIYEQLALTGNGAVDLTNPVVTKGLRNLDGFGGLDVQDGKQVVDVDVDGEENLRSVSDYEGDLPLDIAVHYMLDGKQVDAADVVGQSGDLTVAYTVRNVTGQTETVSIPDGHGGTIKRDVEVILPMVGSLSTVLPSSFRDVRSGEANMAGDGEGGTQLNFTMTLLAPIGSDTAEFGYSAHVTDAVVPQASVSALPVDPLESPSFKSAGTSYQSGASTGAELANGAAQIDENLLKLRDGAGDLLAGLIQLRDGAGQLSDGLYDDAVPGAGRLSAGADELQSGLGRIDEGAGRLKDGSARLSSGSQDALRGSQKLTDGLGRLSAGLDKLSGVKGLPAAQDGIRKLKAGVDTILANFGDPTKPETLIGGLVALNSGLTQLEAGSGGLVAGLQRLNSDSEGLGALIAQIQANSGPLQAKIQQGLGQLGQVAGSIKADPGCTGACQPKVDGLIGALTVFGNTLSTELTQSLGNIIGGIQLARSALTNPDPTQGLIAGAQMLNAKLGEAKVGSAKLLGGATKLKAGNQKVRNGLDDLSVGITAAVSGVMRLSSGAGDAHTGSGTLTNGLGQIAGGAGDLAGGAGQLADGTGQAYDGSGRLSDGAGKLADGLGDAADGSGLLVDGLGKAVDGVPQLRDGAQKLSDKGTSKLVDAGESTAQEYGQMYAVLAAGAERAQEDKMIVGAPDDAVGLAAYSFEIQGEDGEGSRNAVRALAGLVVIGAGAGAFALRRRLV
jgi:putative membrane protein